MREMDICMAQYILDFFGVQSISCNVVSGILGVHPITASNIMQDLSWDKQVIRTKTRRGNCSLITIFHRNGASKQMNNTPSRLARKKAARMLAVNQEDLLEVYV